MADHSGYFGMGELSQRCHDGIRVAGDKRVTADDLAAQAMKGKGLGDQRLQSGFIRRFHWVLGRLQRDGRINRLGDGKG
jgi:hypothetical protein